MDPSVLKGVDQHEPHKKTLFRPSSAPPFINQQISRLYQRGGFLIIHRYQDRNTDRPNGYDDRSTCKIQGFYNSDE